MQTLQDLPDLAMLKMFSFFSNEEKIKRLSLVCRRWYLLLQADIQQLCIYDREMPYRLFWGPLWVKEIDHQVMVRTKTLNEKFAIRFGNLKKLFFFKVTRMRLFLSSLHESSLNQLVELKVMHSESKCDLLLNSKINLPNLRKLSSDPPGRRMSLDEFHAPKLESIAWCFCGNVCSPERIKSYCADFSKRNKFFAISNI